MKKLAFSALGLALLAGTAAADISAEHGAQFGGYYTVDIGTGETTYHGMTNPSQRFVGTIYDNTSAPSAANYGFSSTDLASIWGDRNATVGTGIVDEQAFTVFNSGSSAGTLLQATVQMLYRRAVDNTLMGGFNGNVNFGLSPLNPGFFSIVTFTGLSGLAISLDTTDVLMTQQVTAKTGAANRLGIVGLQPINVGSSIPQMFIQSSTVNAGTPGYYNITSGNPPVAILADVGYRTVTIPAPATVALMGLGGLVASRRRR